MGVGFVSAGFCPGTSLCAVAIGKIDAIGYVVGIMIGIVIFAELYDLFKPQYEGYAYGALTLDETFGISPYMIAFILTVIAILAFVIGDIVRKRTKKVFY